MDPLILALIAYLAFSGLIMLALAIEGRRYSRFRWLYYRDQQRLAKLRWEREHAFRS